MIDSGLMLLLVAFFFFCALQVICNWDYFGSRAAEIILKTYYVFACLIALVNQPVEEDEESFGSGKGWPYRMEEGEMYAGEDNQEEGFEGPTKPVFYPDTGD